MNVVGIARMNRPVTVIYGGEKKMVTMSFETDYPDEAFFSDIKGFMPREEGVTLFRLAKEFAKSGPALEIGSYCGKSAVYLGCGCRAAKSVLFSVDHHMGNIEQQPGQAYFDMDLFNEKAGKVDTLPFFRKTMEKAALTDYVIPVVTSSKTLSKAWKMPVSLLFIDGNHDYESVLKDYQNWEPHVSPGGIIVFHDVYENPEEGGQAPFQVYSEALSSEKFTLIERTGSLRALKKTERI